MFSFFLCILLKLVVIPEWTTKNYFSFFIYENYPLNIAFNNWNEYIKQMAWNPANIGFYPEFLYCRAYFKGKTFFFRKKQ